MSEALGVRPRLLHPAPRRPLGSDSWEFLHRPIPRATTASFTDDGRSAMKAAINHRAKACRRRPVPLPFTTGRSARLRSPRIKHSSSLHIATRADAKNPYIPHGRLASRHGPLDDAAATEVGRCPRELDVSSARASRDVKDHEAACALSRRKALKVLP